MTQPSKPLDDPILDEILARYGRNYRMGFDVVAKKEAKQDLLKWRSDYVMGLLPAKREYGHNDLPVVIEQIKAENRIIDLIKRKLKGRGE